MARLSRRVRNLAVFLFAMIIYYAVVLPLLLPVTDSITNILEAHNLTQITIPQKVYELVNGSYQWVDRPVTLDLTGLIHFILLLGVAFAPIVIGLGFLRV